MDYFCAKFYDFIFSRFSYIVRTESQGKSCGPYLSASEMRFTKRRYTNVWPLPFFFADKKTESHTEADDRHTLSTTVGVSNDRY